ncbi:hypothetical protein RI543_001304 [Arxiozyma heterogenica]|uniref:Conserved oligomeric Golgi complex subunit 3 n=1 Tax=Arxiozyma heterogenica TaxID=278026 RepID=A0AAN7WQ58_9SACH|nr:hypothetical protein RI543_001304 [Kazachstania heterogenica]
MVRSRRNSLVQNIASKPSISNEIYSINNIFDDTYLVHKLQNLSLELTSSGILDNSNGGSDTYTNSSNTSNINDPDIQACISNNKYTIYEDYLEKLNDTLDNYQDTLNDIQSINDNFDHIIYQFNQISLSTTKFLSDISEFHDSHIELTKLSETIPKYLHYFDSLDLIMRRLNHSTSANIVKRDSFRKLLANIDESLIFFHSHADLLDSESYRIKFKQCLIRACTLISHYVSNIFKLTYNDISEKDNLLQNPNTRDALIYNKFSSISEIIYQPLQELLTRCYDSNLIRYRDELVSILKDCYGTYFDIRSKLLFPVIWSQLDEIITKQKDCNLVTFLGSMKSYFQDVCQNEYKLFITFFTLNSKREKEIKDVINSWLVKLCEPLYNTTTNKILREPEISQLCDSIVLFQPYYEFEEGSEEYMKQFNEVYYNTIFEPIMNKLRNQLAKRCKNLITTNLLDYKPTINDLMISNRDTSKKSMTEYETSILNSYVDTLSQRLLLNNTRFESTNMILITYYTPLLRSLSLLFKIYDILVDSTLFDELCHYVVHNGILSLRRAYSLHHGSANTLDIKLIYLTNLLLLRDEMQNLNISNKFDESNSQLSFSPMETIIKSIKWSNSALFSFAKGLVPGRRENSIYSNGNEGDFTTTIVAERSQQMRSHVQEKNFRFELIQELRKIIKIITDDIGSEIIGETLHIDTTDNYETNEEYQQEHSLVDKNKNFENNMTDSLKKVYTRIMEIIHNKTICKFLLEAIKDYIINEYRQYYTKFSTLIEKKQTNRDILNEIMTPDVVSQLFYSNLKSLTENNAAAL